MVSFLSTEKCMLCNILWPSISVLQTAFANSEAPDQMAYEDANWSVSALFVIQYVNLYQ